MKNVLNIATLLFVVVANSLAHGAELKIANANAAFEIGGVVVTAGETYRGELKVPGGDDEDRIIHTYYRS